MEINNTQLSSIDFSNINSIEDLKGALNSNPDIDKAAVISAIKEAFGNDMIYSIDTVADAVATAREEMGASQEGTLGYAIDTVPTGEPIPEMFG